MNLEYFEIIAHEIDDARTGEGAAPFDGLNFAKFRPTRFSATDQDALDASGVRADAARHYARLPLAPLQKKYPFPTFLNIYRAAKSLELAAQLAIAHAARNNVGAAGPRVLRWIFNVSLERSTLSSTPSTLKRGPSRREMITAARGSTRVRSTTEQPSLRRLEHR